METTYLREYILLAERGSFTATARELHLTQSTLSKHIAALEREFGAELFVRERSGIKLTKEGEILLSQAIKVDDILKQTAHAIQGNRAESSGRTISDTDTIRDTALRCKCARLAERSDLSPLEVGALILYLEERGFDEIQRELGLSRDEAADVLGSVYRKLDVRGKQEVLDLIHSISE